MARHGTFCSAGWQASAPRNDPYRCEAQHFTATSCGDTLDSHPQRACSSLRGAIQRLRLSSGAVDGLLASGLRRQDDLHARARARAGVDVCTDHRTMQVVRTQAPMPRLATACQMPGPVGCCRSHTCCLSASATLILLWRTPSLSRMLARLRRSASACSSMACTMPRGGRMSFISYLRVTAVHSSTQEQPSAPAYTPCACM